MINDAYVFLAGFAATDPAFKRLDSGASSAKLRIAYTARRLNRETGEWSDGPTSFVSVQCWRRLAENVAISVRKGEPVVVQGRLQVRQYQNKQGETRTAVEVDATSVGHDLNRGVAVFSRTQRALRAPESLLPAGAEEEGSGPRPEEGAGDAGVPQEAAGDAAPGNGVLDERAVADFARELAEMNRSRPGEPLSAAWDSPDGGEAKGGPLADREAGVAS